MALTSREWVDAVGRATALESESIWAAAVDCKPLAGGLSLITFRPDRVKQGAYTGTRDVQLDETVEGCTIFHKPFARAGQAATSAWSGAVVSVLPATGELTIRIAEGRRPAAGDPFIIRPPSYLEGLKDWLLETTLPPSIDDAWRSRIGATKVTSLRPLPDPDAWLRTAQREACLLTGAPVALVWGPPGTGKTTTLAALAKRLLLGGQRVLVVAPTRIAADGAALAIDRALSDARVSRYTGDVLRSDLPVLAEAFESQNPDLLIWSSEDTRYQELLPKLRKQSAEARHLSLVAEGIARDEALAAAGTLSETEELVRRAWQARQRELIDRCRVLVATTRQAINRSWAALFAHTFVDEASMVPVSDGSALLLQQNKAAPRSLILFGDPRQLGPIPPRERGSEDDAPDDGQARAPQLTPEVAQRWFGESVLEFAERTLLPRGMPSSFLNEQSRMTPALCAVVSAHSYNGALLPAPEAPEPGLPPAFPNPIAVVSRFSGPDWLDAVTLPRAPEVPGFLGRSRYDIAAARQVARLARKLARDGHSVIVCTPFRAQASILQRSLGDLPAIRAGTVHRVQGQEADAAIFDPVDPRHTFISHGPVAQKIINVAASRAKKLFILVGESAELSVNPNLRPFVAAAKPLR